eukprot:CAMPEP_0202877628 /NCGR_PEP_ID=MMETSP1391-20130828/30955_1 /ASSEMBLY_ACC=CAM_ASM_000867 /TAXON_ID=1034604 /ORGANISM="Chlamydomonas leiostraca, Strain SAG 11-49" /LENGTH=143 /DNA_ID=CAMNT_0049559697 /DNA_START=19 /DNA_END=449 /DNA_ORIENTATION=-
MDVVQELEHYLSKNTIDIFVREMMVQCLKDKPEEPKQYLLKYILGKNAGESTEEVAVASTSSEKDGAPMHVAVSHPDTAMQQYLTDKKVAAGLPGDHEAGGGAEARQRAQLHSCHGAQPAQVAAALAAVIRQAVRMQGLRHSV